MESKLNEFMFNLDTLRMLSNNNWSKEEIVENMEKVNLNQDIVNLVLDNESLLNSVLLRIRVDENHSKSHITSSLSSLNNSGIDSLVEYLFVNEHVTHLSNEDEDNDSETSELDSNVRLEKFLSECIEITDDSDNTVKLNEFYSQLNTWWENLYDTEVPDKKELKTFLTTNLGKSSKSTWSSVNLIC